jgi:hypothetical protein
LQLVYVALLAGFGKQGQCPGEGLHRVDVEPDLLGPVMGAEKQAFRSLA